jgi:hypothetical protein
MDSTEQLDASDELARRFLLGQLSATEQSTFEERLLTDDRLEVLVRLAECELADDYAYERLSHAERQLFRQRFMVSADRQRKLTVSSALHDRFGFIASESLVQTTTLRERLGRLLRLDQPARRVAFGVVLLLLLAGTVWLILREPHINKLVQRPRARPTPVATPEVTHHGSDMSSPPVHRETSSPMPVHEPPVVLDVVLAPGDAPTLVSLPKGERDIIRLRLALKGNESGTYRAELLTSAGQSVSEAKTLKPVDAWIDFDVPARLLKAGDYQVKLTRADESSDGVTLFHFRVTGETSP